MKKTSVKIVHISDMHLSKGWGDDPCQWKNVFNFGHHLDALFALGQTLDGLEWDVLVVSGDLSRAGEESSFSEVKKYLFGKATTPEGERIGLDLFGKKKLGIVVPGNHDRYNGLFIFQGDLVRYEKFFESRPAVVFKKEGVCVNFCLFDSSYNGGGIAEGRVGSADMRTDLLDKNSLNVAVLHHHIICAPGHTRSSYPRALRLKNADEVMGYFLAGGFDAVLFGHTHKDYMGRIPFSQMLDRITDKNRGGHVWEKWVPHFILKMTVGDDLSFDIERTKNGNDVSQEDFWIYLFARYIFGAKEVKSPSQCRNSSEFHEGVAHYKKYFLEEVKKVRRRNLLLSMAPSVSKVNVGRQEFGFHLIEYFFEDGVNARVEGSWYRYADGRFFVSKSKRLK